ncbi:MAG TPA: hypothetical protein VGQ57_21490 [Polyangiaceae bacterium]|nr:hypothetical protein [Polyangiaceae bacterium]
MMRTEKWTVLALSLCGFTGLTACGNENDKLGGQSAGQESVGSVNLGLTLPDGRSITGATYTITGPNAFAKTGSINTSQSSGLSILVGGLPAGSGYSITISASTSDKNDTCGGSNTFAVQSGKISTVNVSVACHEKAKTGSVLVNGVVNLCPTVDGINANPDEVEVGGSVTLAALAHDSDAGPSALAYQWTVTGGTLSSDSVKSPTFTCGSSAGSASVSVTVNDGDPAASCAATASATITCSAKAKTPGNYVAGDFHNHTTCSDGSISMQKLIKKATDRVDTPWGLDWFVQAGHGGNGNRNCTLVEDASLSTPAYPFVSGKDPNTSWENSGVTPKGDSNGTSPNKNMWRWQSIQEFQYQVVEYMNALKNLPLFIGIETVAPGHEHTSMSVITGQIPEGVDSQMLPSAPPYKALGNADALAQWEYCFDRADTDTSRGAANQWDCSVPGSANSSDASWNSTAHKLVPAGGTGTGTKGHAKTLEAIKWMSNFHPDTSYYVPAHLERAGQFNPDGNNGFNVESLRDFNNAGPKIAFGMETQPGHGASSNRGEYQVLRNTIGGKQVDSVGGTTFGGTGVYGGIVGGVWDAMLGEGRNFWFFASSDWHNRGKFGPDDRRSTQDFYPGEYQRNYTLVRAGSSKPKPQQIVDGLRSGNNFGTQGQLIDRLSFVVCKGKSEGIVSELAVNAAVTGSTIDVAGCATMGQKLVVDAGTDLVVGVAVRDPAGANFSPYTFANPSLSQIGVSQPINMPVLDHIDLIGGLVTGYRTPGTAGYSGAWPVNEDWLKADGTTTGLANVPDAAKNTSTAVLRTFNGNGATPWETVTSQVDGTDFLAMTFRIAGAQASQYVRLRGTNMPPAVPYETDKDGNPQSDVYTNANDTKRLTIPCTVAHSDRSQFDGCPDHMETATGSSPIAGQKAVTYDVAAWSDVWFYANPIYIEVNGGTPVAGVQ